MNSRFYVKKRGHLRRVYSSYPVKYTVIAYITVCRYKIVAKLINDARRKANNVRKKKEMNEHSVRM